MGKNLKRIACCLSAASLLAALCSCTAEKDGIKKISVWSPDSHSKTVMNKIVSDWNESRGKELGVEIVYEIKENDIQQTVDMAYESEQAPDMFSSVQVEKHATANHIVALDDMEGGKEFLSKYDPESYLGSKFQYDGKTYTVPASVNTFGLVYNKDMFKKYGIVDENGEPTPPKTFKEMREYAKRMTNTAEKDYGIILPMKWGAFYSVDVGQLAQGSAGRITFDCTSGKYDFSIYKPIYEMYLGMKEDGSIFPGEEALDNDTARAYFAERNIGMKLAGSFDVGVYNTQFPAKCDWGVAPYPRENENDKYYYYLGTGGSYSISTTAREKASDDVLLEIYNLFVGPETAKKLYQEGMSIYYDASVLEGITPGGALKGWSDFAALVNVSKPPYKDPGVILNGVQDAKDYFYQEVWTGKVTVDEAIEALNERYNKGMDEWFENNPDYKKEDYLNPDLNLRIKD